MQGGKFWSVFGEKDLMKRVMMDYTKSLKFFRSKIGSKLRMKHSFFENCILYGKKTFFLSFKKLLIFSKNKFGKLTKL